MRRALVVSILVLVMVLMVATNSAATAPEPVVVVAVGGVTFMVDTATVDPVAIDRIVAVLHSFESAQASPLFNEAVIDGRPHGARITTMVLWPANGNGPVRVIVPDCWKLGLSEVVEEHYQMDNFVKSIKLVLGVQ
jgi:hypothetical protein